MPRMMSDTDLGNFVNKALIEHKWRSYFEAKQQSILTETKKLKEKEDNKNENKQKTNSPSSTETV